MPETQKNAKNAKTTKRPVQRFMYGYVFFRQQKDDSIQRGYLQKSVLLISRHSYYGLFKKVISTMGPMFFEFGPALLEAAYQQCCSWPARIPGNSVALPILGKIINFNIPYSGTAIVQAALSVSPKDQVMNNMQVVNIYNCFKTIQTKLWLLWELVLLGEPILVVSSSPTTCSDAVLGLISLISPIEYGGDFRPYFTIHDTDFKRYTNKKRLPSCILGVTNPFFFKALDHWPHIITIGDETTKTVSSMKKGGKDRATKTVNEYKNEVKTKHKPFFTSDKNVTKQLMKQKPNSGLNSAVNNELLRRHFFRMTETFMGPLESYCLTLIPGNKTMSPFAKIPIVRPFMEATFITHLIKLGKTTKELEMYRTFIRTSNFINWFRKKKREAINEINKRYYQILSEYNLEKHLEGRTEVEVVDLYLRVKDIMKQKPVTMPSELRKKI